MVKKDYEKAVKIVAATRSVANRRLIAVAFGCLFSDDNPRFDLNRFLEACHKESA